MEIWKDVVGYEDSYEISNLGNCRSKDRKIFMDCYGGYEREFKGQVLKTNKLRNGYLRFTLMDKGVTKRFSVHRLVALNFIPNPENKPQVNHIDGNKENNHVDNLEWCTSSENHKHAHRIGLESQKGSKNNGSKLTEEDVEKIKVMLLHEIHVPTIAKMFNVSRGTIYPIKKGKQWKHVLLKNF